MRRSRRPRIHPTKGRLIAVRNEMGLRGCWCEDFRRLERLPHLQHDSPPIGADVLPLAPVYHWNDAAAALLIATDNVMLCPLLMLPDCGCVVIAGGVHVPPPPVVPLP